MESGIIDKQNDKNASFSALDFVQGNNKLIKCILIEFSVNCFYLMHFKV